MTKDVNASSGLQGFLVGLSIDASHPNEITSQKNPCIIFVSLTVNELNADDRNYCHCNSMAHMWKTRIFATVKNSLKKFLFFVYLFHIVSLQDNIAVVITENWIGRPSPKNVCINLLWTHVWGRHEYHVIMFGEVSESATAAKSFYTHYQFLTVLNHFLLLVQFSNRPRNLMYFLFFYKVSQKVRLVLISF